MWPLLGNNPTFWGRVRIKDFLGWVSVLCDGPGIIGICINVSSRLVVWWQENRRHSQVLAILPVLGLPLLWWTSWPKASSSPSFNEVRFGVDAVAMKEAAFWLASYDLPSLPFYSTQHHSGLGHPKSIINQEMYHRLVHTSFWWDIFSNKGLTSKMTSACRKLT